MSDADKQANIGAIVHRYCTRTEDERQQERQTHIAKLTAKANDPTLDATTRADSAQLLINIAEDIQVENLYAAVSESPDPEITARADPLIKIFMNERAEMLQQQQQPRTIGTPDQFFEWLYNKPRFK